MATASKKELLKEAALNDFETFIRLIHPDRVLGHVHEDLCRWWTRDNAKSHQLVLLPRDHQKSALLAYRVAWTITKDPSIRVLYISSTANLATKQLKFIKDILTCDAYTFYWPDMVNTEESKREKWTESEISVDHPLRKARNVRDPTVFTAGLTTGITGMHCDVAALDDVVVDDNAYSDDGREKVRNQASYLASIAGTEASLWAVGTRYHPKDLYNDYQEQTVELFDTDGNPSESYELFETYERRVENRGDGTGEYLWPRQQGTDGRWFGFNQRVLATKKAQYSDVTKFSAQYYNNPNDSSTAPITKDMFQYYKPELLLYSGKRWTYEQYPVATFAAIDFAYSLSRRADYTAIVVVGVDSRNNYYVLEVSRFKTVQIGEYFNELLKLYSKWGFTTVRAEVTAGQAAIVNSLKEMITSHGVMLSVDEFRPTVKEGSKEQRMEAILQPRYKAGKIWHYRGGHCQTLEEELVLQNPAHDDVKDALAACIDVCKPISHRPIVSAELKQKFYHNRFGGIG